MLRDHYQHAILHVCAKFHWNLRIRCRVMAKKWFSIGQSSAILN